MWAFVREHLSASPLRDLSTQFRGWCGSGKRTGSTSAWSATMSLVIVVPMTAAEFYTGLEQRFPVRDAMYFLPDQVEAYERFRITFKELAPSELFITARISAVQWLRQVLGARRRAYADIQPLFMRELQSGLPPGTNCRTCVRCWRRTSSPTTGAASRSLTRRRPSISISCATRAC